MMIELTPQSIITAGAVVTAAVLLVQRFARGVRWFDQQSQQTEDIEAMKKKHETDIKALKEAVAADMHGINTEQTLLTYGVLACLKGLKEKGCNGPLPRLSTKLRST